jgi:phage shock protein A
LSIGTLTTGGDASQQSLQQARDLIASVDRRAMSLPPRITNAERPQLRQVQNYLDKAKQALNTGDAEGAVNLASKAQQLVDELERR